MNKEKLTIAGIEQVGSGFKKTGEPWKRYRVTDSNGKKHSTFLEDLQIGGTYDFLTIKEPFVSKKDGKTYQSSKITGFDNVAYEANKTRPIGESTTLPTQSMREGFNAEDRRMLTAIYDTVVKVEPTEEIPY